MSRADVDDFLARIDEVTAPACGACSATLDPGGPSLYFCDDECSGRWHTTQAEPLTGYREPWQRSEDFPGVGDEQFRPNRPPLRVSIDTDQATDSISALHRGLVELDRRARQSAAQVFVTSTPDDPASGWRPIGRVSGASPTFTFVDEADWARPRISAEDCTLTLHTSSDALPHDLRRLVAGEWDAPQVQHESDATSA